MTGYCMFVKLVERPEEWVLGWAPRDGTRTTSRAAGQAGIPGADSRLLPPNHDPGSGRCHCQCWFCIGQTYTNNTGDLGDPTFIPI